MGKFEIYTGNNEKVYFRLKAGNGQPILVSQGYSSKSGAKNGIESVKENSQDDAMFEQKVAKSGQHYFNLLTKNKQVIGKGEMYEATSGMENGIGSVKKNAPDAEVIEL